ncbi:MAG: hypothetical protein GWN61_17200 [candidate division Zixibacteria bacterium]|nr:hypothetical protein [candidate division Zixibacteria bacterium]NIS47612.1 hypothetical protein [candidate division Zixibacteria bacterium]NIU15701.1 hypothetical protein [candidate division Zixibacteria bacterium]NIV07859.1 hypothetical protein [candidate division Zixibacteria bacterium]NIX58077.1 hypothetical protein [candidate division Zixibacteria bacterium]
MEKDKASDILFGFLSVIDQFSSVIIERGREFRKTDKGKAIAESLHSLNGLMDKTQKDSINSLSSLMDVLLVIAQTCEKEISTQSNGSSNGSNGSAKEHDDPDIKQ